MPLHPSAFEAWLDETFGRAVTGSTYPQFVVRDVESWPDPVPDIDALHYLTQVFEQPETWLRRFSDNQIAAGLWELGPGDSHCIHNPDIALNERVRLIGSVETFFRDFFDHRCTPILSHAAAEHISPLNTACYMWWEFITMGWPNDDPAASYLHEKDLDVMEAVLELPNIACKEAALHGLGHHAQTSERASAIIGRFLESAADLSPDLVRYARAASAGCIQ